MPTWTPPPPLQFDRAAATALAQACRHAADELARIGADRAALLARVADWEGPRREALEQEDRRVAQRWSAVADELRAVVAAVNAATDWARAEGRRRDDEQLRWELEADAERRAEREAQREARREAERRAEREAEQEAQREARSVTPR